jgi:hypothetical protein
LSQSPSGLIEVLYRPEPSFLTSTCCTGEDFGDENIKQIECIIERNCFQIENEGDESADTPVIWHSIYCAGFSHRREASESLNSTRRHTARHRQIDTKPAHIVDSA